MTNPPLPHRERLVAIDVFRGLTVAGMLLVNDPGSWSAIYPPLEHATWNGWTPTDLIFPKWQSELFKTITEEENLRSDRDGRARTAYSLRHTYISMRLIEGANI